MKKTQWEFKQATPDRLELYIYGYIRQYHYDGSLDEVVESETSAEYFRKKLAEYPNVSEIVLYVNSNGGDVMLAMAIRNQLKRHPATKTAYVDGFACSAASFILTACDKVIMYSNTMQMLHHMYTVTIGNYLELRKASEDLEKISIGNRQAYVEKSGDKLTEEQVEEILANETWLTAKECLDIGLADEIIHEEKDLTEARKIAQLYNQSLEQQISYNRALVAMIKESLQPESAIPTPTLEPDPAPPEETKPLRFLSALLSRKEV